MQGSLAQPVYSLQKEIQFADEEDPVEFFFKKRHLFIITETGKAVYSRYSDEADISPIMATFNVIIHKLRRPTGEEAPASIRRIRTASTVTVVRQIGLLFFIYVSKDLSDCTAMMDRSLDVLHHQLVCCITASFKQTMVDKPNFNPGNNLAMFNQTLAWTMAASRSSLAPYFSAFMPLPVTEAQLRTDLEQTLRLFQHEGVIFKMVVTPEQVVCLDGSDFDVAPEDVNSILHLIGSKFLMEGVDYFMPYCVPSVSDEGYINVYFRFLQRNVGLVLLCSDQQKIAECVQICQKVEIVLRTENMMAAVEQSIALLPKQARTVKHAKYVFVLNEKVRQFQLWGMRVYGRRSESETAFIHAVVDMHQLYERMGRNMDFEVVRKVKDSYVGVLRDRDILVFVQLQEWAKKEEMRGAFRELSQLLRTEYSKYFFTS